jgi:ribosomal protein L7/L12
MSITQEAREEVEKLIRQRQKLQAIQYLRETFQISLADAKQLVDALDKELAPPSADLSLSEDDTKALEQLLRADKKIEGVKFVRSKLGLGLKEALQVVEGIERMVNPNFVAFKPGCRGNLVKMVALVLFSIGLTLFWMLTP